MKCRERFVHSETKASIVAGWLIPTAMLVIIPKCPLCLIGYAAVIGIGLSASTATFTRAFLIGGCVSLFIYATFKIVRRLRDIA